MGRSRSNVARGAGRQLLLVPSAVVLVLFFLVPLGLTAVYSFGDTDLLSFETHLGWSLENYASLGRSLYLGTIVRSLVLSLLATTVCAVIAVPLAYFIVEQPRRVQALLLLAVIVPFWTSFVIRTYAWINILQNRGPLDRFLNAIGVIDGPLNLLYTPASIAIGIVFSYLPLMILPVYVALERRDPSVLEAAADLGSHGVGMLLRVIVPLAAPGLLAGAVLVGIPAMGEFVIPEILGGGKTLMLGNVIGTQFLVVGDLALGSAMAMCLMLVVLVVLIAAFWRPRRRTT
jgi:spermidine/putrescine transport system permease protein